MEVMFPIIKMTFLKGLALVYFKDFLMTNARSPVQALHRWQRHVFRQVY